MADRAAQSQARLWRAVLATRPPLLVVPLRQTPFVPGRHAPLLHRWPHCFVLAYSPVCAVPRAHAGALGESGGLGTAICRRDRFPTSPPRAPQTASSGSTDRASTPPA